MATETIKLEYWEVFKIGQPKRPLVYTTLLYVIVTGKMQRSSNWWNQRFEADSWHKNSRSKEISGGRPQVCPRWRQLFKQTKKDNWSTPEYVWGIWGQGSRHLRLFCQGTGPDRFCLKTVLFSGCFTHCMASGRDEERNWQYGDFYKYDLNRKIDAM